jgi:alginate O-acetyltransferase complex protein AlgI
MLFPTLDFGLFFLVVFALAWSVRGATRWRLALLTAASYVFYAAWDWRFCLLLFASSFGNWFFGRAIAATPGPLVQRRWLALAVTLNLVVLGFFKYFNFFVDSANSAFETLGSTWQLPYLGIVLPVGISFFTFHGISYVVDLYKKRLDEPATLLQLMLYISFFPQLVAGPIVRAAHFLPQLRAPADAGDIRVTRAMLLIVGGLFKKVVVANYLATDLVEDVFFDPTLHSPFDLALASYGYAIQIYCDFSAYTDIAIGVAALLGYRFPQNFDQPYRALGLRNFWQRWHISLSSWLRDYLYIPLGGDTGDWRRYRNLMLTMLLGGLWHGAAWTFVVWGALHGLLLIAEHLLVGAKQRMLSWRRWQRALGIVMTFHLVCLTWIIFRSPDFEHALQYLHGFGAFDQPTSAVTPETVVLVAGGVIAQFLPRDRMERIERVVAHVPVAIQGAFAGICIVAIDSMGAAGVAPFIYFQF